MSSVDQAGELNNEAPYEDSGAEMKVQSEGPLKGVLGYTDDKVVANDFRGETCTSMFDADADADSGIALDKTFVGRVPGCGRRRRAAAPRRAHRWSCAHVARRVTGEQRRSSSFVRSLSWRPACYKHRMHTFLKPWSCAATLLAAVLAWPISVTAQPAATAEPPAFGLIMGLRSDPSVDEATQVERGPWASPREARRAWETRQAGTDRERTAQVVREAGLTVRALRASGRAQLLKFRQPLAGTALQDAMRRARLHPDVAWVEPDVLLKPLQVLTPNDPELPRQWALGIPDGSALADINLLPAWGLTTGSNSVHMAVLDTGILPHPDLVGRVLSGYDFVSEVEFAGDRTGRDADPTDPGDWVALTGNDPAVQAFVDRGQCGDFSTNATLDRSSWHGTFIAGQLAAATNNSVGVAGVTWAGKVLPVRVSGKCGAMLSDLLDGMRWAAGLPVAGVPDNLVPARVINLSFGGDRSCASSSAYQTTIDAVTAAGSLVVVAAGNAATQLTRPADCQRVLSVGAVRRDGLKTAYSSFGPQLGLMAPGGSNEDGDVTRRDSLYSTDNGGSKEAGAHTYGYKNGTSFAAPWASGVAALMLAVNPALTPSQLIDRLRAGARRWDEIGASTFPDCSNALPSQGVCRCTEATCGAGLLDAAMAVQLAQGPAVVMDAVGTQAPGATVVLNGAASIAIPGSSIVAYQWRQIEGPPVPIALPGAAVTSVTLGGPGSYAFELTVTDQLVRTGRDVLRVTVVAPTGGGGGASGLWWGGLLWLWVAALGHTRLRCRRSR